MVLLTAVVLTYSKIDRYNPIAFSNNANPAIDQYSCMLYTIDLIDMIYDI